MGNRDDSAFNSKENGTSLALFVLAIKCTVTDTPDTSDPMDALVWGFTELCNIKTAGSAGSLSGGPRGAAVRHRPIAFLKKEAHGESPINQRRTA